MVRSPRSSLRSTVQRVVVDLSDADSVRAAVGPDIHTEVHVATPLGDWELEALHALGSPQKRFVCISGVC